MTTCAAEQSLMCLLRQVPTNASCAAVLTRQFAEHTVRKTYLAPVNDANATNTSTSTTANITYH